MRVKIKPGEEFETLTPDELRRELDGLRIALAKKPAVVRFEKAGPTTATGALTLEGYKPPLGMEFRLTRLVVLADGFSPAVPFNGAGAFLELLRNDVPIAWQSLVAAAAINASALPSILVDADSETSAAYYANADCVAVRLTNGPVSTNITVRGEGVLNPFVEGN